MCPQVFVTAVTLTNEKTREMQITNIYICLVVVQTTSDSGKRRHWQNHVYNTCISEKLYMLKKILENDIAIQLEKFEHYGCAMFVIQHF